MCKNKSCFLIYYNSIRKLLERLSRLQHSAIELERGGDPQCECSDLEFIIIHCLSAACLFRLVISAAVRPTRR